MADAKTCAPQPRQPRCNHVVLDAVGPQDASGFIVTAPGPGVPAFEGHWETDYTCAACDELICKGVKPGLFAGIVFRCSCGQLNRLPLPVGPGSERLSAFS